MKSIEKKIYKILLLQFRHAKLRDGWPVNFRTTDIPLPFCRVNRIRRKKLTPNYFKLISFAGELTVEQRLAVLDRFRAGLEKVLITTNVLSRGIDVEQVTIVVNFDLPVDLEGKADCETYLHRIGRTGRFGKMQKKKLRLSLIDFLVFLFGRQEWYRY